MCCINNNLDKKVLEYSCTFPICKVIFHNGFIFKTNNLILNTKWTKVIGHFMIQKDCGIRFNITETEFEDWSVFVKLAELFEDSSECVCDVHSFLWPEPLSLLVSSFVVQSYRPDRSLYKSLEINFCVQIQRMHPAIEFIKKQVYQNKFS